MVGNLTRPMAAAGSMALAAGLAASGTTATAASLHATVETYRAHIRSLAPGDTLRLAPGEYRGGLRLHGLMGRPDAPIVIEGPEAGEPAVFVAAPGRNTVSILDSAHVVVRNLVVDGRGLPVDGVKCEGHARFAHHITLENLVIRGHGHNQQTVGISTKCPAWNWVIRGNLIEGAGTGIYLGNSDGRAPFVAGLIEHNTIRDTLGYNLQIKHQMPRPELPGMPARPTETVIRRNVFVKAAGGSAEMARPNVLVGHWPLAGPGREDRYLIYGNLFQHNRHEALFQGEGNLALYNNVLLNAHGDAVRIQPHNDIPRDVTIAYNTVLARGVGISLRLGPGSEAHTQTVTHNAVFADRPFEGVAVGSNLAATLAQSGRVLRNPGFELEGADLRPREGSLPAFAPPRLDLPELASDFDGRPRAMSLPGAYAPATGPLQWPPAQMLWEAPFPER